MGFFDPLTLRLLMGNYDEMLATAAPVVSSARAQHVPPPPKPLELRPIAFSPVKKRRQRQTLKKYPFEMKVDNVNYYSKDDIRLRMDETLRQQLSPAGIDWLREGRTYYFTKREYAVLLVTLYRGTKV